MSDGRDGGSTSFLRDKLKNILSSNTSKSQSSQYDEETEDKECINLFPEDFWSTVSNKNGAQSPRVAQLNQVEKIIVAQSVPKACLKRLWVETNDLLNLDIPRSIRHEYFQFLVVLIKSQHRKLGMLKLIFYNTLIEKNFTDKEDISDMMLIFDAITEHG